MSDNQPGVERRDLLTRALVQIESMQRELKRFENAKNEPIAIVGMGCRYPGGADSPDEFWQLLQQGYSGVCEIPADRFEVDDYFNPDPEEPGKIYVRHGAFLGRVKEFDSQFFNISPNEAACLDPQQRLLLEVSWEAFESACLPADQLLGSNTAVFIGTSSFEHASHIGQASPPERIDAYFGTGGALSAAAGRLSYFYGLKGPALTVDTACSSSLVAIHQACQALRSGEADLALSGGVNVLMTPQVYLTFCKARMLARDGRCKTFDASADGFVRGEGCGLLVLQRLSDALSEGRRILAVIRGSSVNQDGASGGFTVPSGPSQQAVIRRALASGGIDAADVGYIEAHGTGTSLGDPIEVGALNAVFGTTRVNGEPLWVGSVKANIGHLEGAAGGAGIIKLILALQHGEIPAQCHFETPSPAIPWERIPVRIPTATTPWLRGARPRIGGVSSFGFTGTNAHVLVEEPPATVRPERAGAPEQHLLHLSARNEDALQQLAGRYAEFLTARTDADLVDVCHSANRGRTEFTNHLAVTGSTAADLARQLIAYQTSRDAPQPVLDRAEWESLEDTQGQWIDLPKYPFQRARHWFEPDRRATASHPLIGRLPAGDPQWTGTLRFELNADRVTWLADHRVFDRIVVPGAAYLEMALALGVARFGGGATLKDVLFHEALILEDGGAAHMEIGLECGDAGELRFRISSAMGRVHCSGIVEQLDETLAVHDDRSGTPMADARELSIEEFYNAAAAVSLHYGPAFQGLKALQAKHGEAWGLARIDLDATDYKIHPALLDAWFQIVGAAQTTGAVQRTLIPAGVARLDFRGTPGQSGSCHLYLTEVPRAEVGVHANLDVVDQNNVQVVRIVGLTFLPVERDNLFGRPEIENLLYRMEYPEKPLLSDRLTAPEEICRILTETAVQLGADPELRLFGALQAELDQLSLLYVVEAFRKLGCRFEPSQRLDTEQWGIREKYLRLLNRLLTILAEAQILKKTAEGWIVIRDPDLPDAETFRQDLMVRYPCGKAELTLLGHCGPRLANVLLGQTDPLELLFPGGKVDAVQAVYETSPGARAMNQLLVTVLQYAEVAGKSPEPLRVLEVGGGTGGATAHLLQYPGSSAVRYIFTDVSPTFVAQAAERFREKAFFEAREFDLEQAPDAQQLPPGYCDVVVAANVLHATRDLSASLRHIHQVLAPRGMLILLEGTGAERWVDLTFGLSEGWWRFADTDLRADYPLLAAEDWLSLLEASGFELARAVGIPADGGSASGQRVIFARRKPETAGDGKWLIYADHAGVGQQLVQRLEQQGERCDLLSPPQMACNSSAAGNYRGAIYLRNLDAKAHEDLASGCGDALAWLQALHRLDSAKTAPVWWVTCAATAVAGRSTFVPVQAALAGIGRTISSEHPELRLRQVDLADPITDMASLVSEILEGDNEAVVSLSAQHRYVARLARHPRLPRAEVAGRVRPDGAYLVTGGLGGLGLCTAQWLIGQGARHIFLMSRNRPSADVRTTLERFRGHGINLTVHQADVTEPQQVAHVLDEIRAGGMPLRGVFHAAGVLEDVILLNQSAERMLGVMAAKVDGSWILHELTINQPLDFFVLYSSIASQLGSAGQGSHVAGNAFLDALAHSRRTEGLPATTINWGQWSEIGSAAQGNWTDRGISPFPPETGIAALETLLSVEATQAGVLAVDWPTFFAQWRDGGEPPELFSRLRTKRKVASGLPGASRQVDTSNIDGAVREIVASVLGFPAAQAASIDPQRPLVNEGLDSLSALQLTRQLKNRFGTDIPALRLIDGMTTSQLSLLIRAGLGPGEFKELPQQRRGPE
ncbi:SDR family NAD(P)-dependent oxidoreductase [Paraburkholderia sp. RL17-337-BIB-A]|uniref:SDR family NAD(P)-dependent oxidoreductase n=1 Tax=Paraburkholderia sp. RL17-337-BIB-A TaxID=3031636 RepID=UPI0038B791B8